MIVKSSIIIHKKVWVSIHQNSSTLIPFFPSHHKKKVFFSSIKEKSDKHVSDFCKSHTQSTAYISNIKERSHKRDIVIKVMMIAGGGQAVVTVPLDASS